MPAAWNTHRRLLEPRRPTCGTHRLRRGGFLRRTDLEIDSELREHGQLVEVANDAPDPVWFDSDDVDAR
jgi:hypothetical protein